MSLFFDSTLHYPSAVDQQQQQQQQQHSATTTAQFSEITNQAPRPSKRAAAAAPPHTGGAQVQQQQQQQQQSQATTVPLPRSSQVASSMPSPTRLESQFPALSQQYQSMHAPAPALPPSNPVTMLQNGAKPAGSPTASHGATTTTTSTVEMVSTFNTLVSQMQTLMVQWQQCYPRQQMPHFDQPAGGPSSDADVSRLMAQVGALQVQLPPPQAPAQQQQQQQQQQQYYPSAMESAPYRSAAAPQPHHHHYQHQQSQPQPHQVQLQQQQQQQQQQFQQQSHHRGGGYQPPHQPPPSNMHHTSPRLSSRGINMLAEPSQCTLALVEFKRARLKKFVSDNFVNPGQYVIVEGDRGVDCGLVVLCCFKSHDGSLSQVSALQDYKISEVMRIKTEVGRVQRIATQEDVDILHGVIATEERNALRECREIAASMHLPMEIIDCEYQYDKRKVSFYFESAHSVDFRELNQELFRRFGVRIWLENVNAKVKNVVPEGALSYADKVNFTKNGLRPPRRTQ